MAVSKDLNKGVKLFSEDLAEAGYENHYFGKWHVSGTENPEDRGWISHTVSARTTDRNGFYWKDYKTLYETGDSQQPPPKEVASSLVNNRGKKVR